MSNIVKPSAKLRGFDPHLVLLTDPFSYVSEQYKPVCVNLRKANEQGKKVFLVSSALAEEGKTLTTINLALGMAQDMKKRTLLIDCDLRKPSVHRYLNLEQRPGLTDIVLNDKNDLTDLSAIKRFGNFSILPAGEPPHNPIEVLISDKMSQLLEALKREYDIIFLDSPPAVPIVDSRILSDVADALLLVVKAGKRKFKVLQKAVRSLKTDKVLGIVLNRTKLNRLEYGYYKHYYSHPNFK